MVKTPEQTPISDDGLSNVTREGDVLSANQGVNSPELMHGARNVGEWPQTNASDSDTRTIPTSDLSSAEQNANAERFDQSRAKSPKQILDGHHP